MCKLSVCFFLLLIAILPVLTVPQAKNILVWAAVSSRSVRLSMTPFIEALAARGHNVSYLTVMEESEQTENQNKIPDLHIFVPKKWTEAMGSWNNYGFEDIRKTPLALAKSWYDFRDLGTSSCLHLYSDPEFLHWVEASPKYDLVVLELAMVNECAYGLVHLWNSKLVIYDTTGVIPGYFDAFGLPDESSTISDITLGLPSGNEMSFLQRFINAMNPIIYGLTKEYSYFPGLEEITRQGWAKLGREEQVPSFVEVEKSASLILITSHFSMEYPRSYPPNVIQVGGNVVAKKKLLTKELADFLDSAKDGFIYINFGSIANFENLEEETKLGIIKALGHFPNIKFLWATPYPFNMALPDNVLLTKWTPQQTVLAHPNIKAFITHSGMGATTEAIHFSVPVISLPIMAEQDHNAHAIASKGAGIKLEIIGLKEEQLRNAISEILSNKNYRLAMNKLSQLFKDRPRPPLEEAVWWVEYVLRHEDINKYIVSPSVRQPWWKRRQIDVWLTAGALCATFIFGTMLILYAIVKRLICGGNASKNQRKIKTN